MKSFLLFSCCIVLFCADNSSPSINYFENESVVDNVYICNSSGAKKYHYKKNCRGLSNCKKEVKEISLEAAKDRGRTLCGWED